MRRTDALAQLLAGQDARGDETPAPRWAAEAQAAMEARATTGKVVLVPDAL